MISRPAAYMVVEGHGEVGAATNLVSRLWTELGLAPVTWKEPIRGRALTRPDGLARACELLRSRPDCTRALILRDEDDGCPRDLGPGSAAWIRAARLPFPVTLTLLHREFETLFLASMASIAGRSIELPGGGRSAGVRAGTTVDAPLESIRGAKEWLSKRFPPGQSYKPTLHQLALTRHVDFTLLRASGLACFGSLERGLRFLASARPGEVNPLAADGSRRRP